MMNQMFSYFGWVLPYFIPGFAAPVLFKNFPPTTAGHIAGALFVGSCLWTLYVARRNGFPVILFAVFRVILIINTLFWSWRFFITSPLAESYLLGFSGQQWHQALTFVYLSQGLLLILGLTWSRRKQKK